MKTHTFLQLSKFCVTVGVSEYMSHVSCFYSNAPILLFSLFVKVIGWYLPFGILIEHIGILTLGRKLVLVVDNQSFATNAAQTISRVWN